MNLMPSEAREYQEKIKSLIQERDAAYAAALRFVTGVINTHPDLDEDLKSSLINKVWSR